MAEKITIVINGVGGAGKDTLISFVSEKYQVKNVSSIDPIKNLASIIGWNGDKGDRSRKFLSDLKKITTDYNDYTLNYCLSKQQEFFSGPEEIMFVHIREPEEIAKFVEKSQGKTLTLLIKQREELGGKQFGNYSDDNVENYDYDLVFNNDHSLEETKPLWLEFFKANEKSYLDLEND